MTYAKLLAAGRAMDDKEIAASVKGLAADPRFAAVVALIDQMKTTVADVSCQEKYSNEHGSLEHAAGIRCGLMMLEARIKQQTEVVKKTGAQRPD